MTVSIKSKQSVDFSVPLKIGKASFRCTNAHQKLKRVDYTLFM